MLKSLFFISATLTSVLADCSYAALQRIASNYVASHATGSFTTVPPSVLYTENFKATSIKTGILSKPLKVDFSRSIHDTVACATYTEVIVTDRTHPYVIGTQLRFTPDAQLQLIETIVTDEGDWLFNATGTLNWSRQENWATIPIERRDTRETIQKAADAYLDLFNDPSAVVPWGTPCARLEGGAYTGRGLPTDSCNVGVPSGVPIVRRRYVIDETLGAVDAFVDFGANKIPDSHQFRVEGGKLRFVHTLSVTGG